MPVESGLQSLIALRMKSVQITLKFLIHKSQKTHYIPITKPNPLMYSYFRKINAIYYEENVE